VIGDEGRRYVEHELLCGAGDVGIWEIHTATMPERSWAH
jgi:hypothetical protein